MIKGEGQKVVREKKVKKQKRETKLWGEKKKRKRSMEEEEEWRPKGWDKSSRQI